MIITLGPSGTYSEIAATKLFPNKEIILKDSFFDIFANHKKNDLMVLPLENSNYGSVIQVWEEIAKKELFISKTLIMEIKHSLGSKSTNFQTIHGHPQAIGQCIEFLHKQYPNAKIETATSTGDAINKALKDLTCAAIGSADIMASKGLQIIHQNISDSLNNKTVFGVINNIDHFPNDPKNTTVILITPQNDRHGLLFNILQIIETHSLNMTRLESRPQGDNLGKYKFFIDLQTSPNSPEFKQTYQALSKDHQVNIIGAY
ncbi:hypothetical protein COV81_00130 [Candidatus Peregrinibacteria bacterium CG11_big_fil_rev_8_21_14_0_20_41_10]|nr:MAG: hypothetical protein COV81_00130 [Candidatus Peregrinibacteria bacterium CG11_big_fil_rev_8_21_14_0_20_41_10]PIZ73346.1 MAG: hypothetical protein COY06_05525 [Candidatus Peregrinibacteria bacterium CG_4_10_14_0_2_um_filter_41_8]PJC38052.1 MAG: hypothetical protein CO045_02325 [Candidatus Peregrinibacteria bacterium CG_4_9_14_0_2_um_filter_41_14]